jgi:hypothetical protein
MTGDQMVAAMDAVGVDGAVLVSPFSMYRYDPSYVLEVQARHPHRFCLLKPVDRNDPAVADSIADWKANKGTVGVRVLMRYNVSTDAGRGGQPLAGGKPAVHGPACWKIAPERHTRESFRNRPLWCASIRRRYAEL